MRNEHLSKKRSILVILLSWLSMIGTDFLIHGGLLAKFYIEPDGFLLPPIEAFKLIPVGYLSFLILACLLVWLMHLLDIRGAGKGFLFGIKLGAFVWGALVLGLLSVTTAKPLLMAGWFLGQTAELGIAGAFAGGAFAEAKLPRLFVALFLLIFLSLFITVLLQNTGLAPSVKQ